MLVDQILFRVHGKETCPPYPRHYAQMDDGHLFLLGDLGGGRGGTDEPRDDELWHTIRATFLQEESATC